MGRDRLSALDDNLLSFHILSKLPLRDAVRCSILSRRWRLLWTLLPHLKIWIADFNAKVIDNIFFFHHGELESLEISIIYRFSWTERNIDDLIWKSVRAASVKRVKQITLRKVGRAPSSGRVRVPSSLFSCDCLTFLKIENFEIKVPSYFSGFRFLRTCILSFFHNIDDILEQIAAKCPLPENLRVVSCYVVRLNHVEISALNLKYLNFSGNHYISSLTLNCPKLMNATIHDSPSMLRLELNSCRDLHFSTTELHLLEGLSNRNSLRKIILDGWSTRLPSLAVLGCFSNLEELAIESKSFEAASPGAGSLTLPLMTNLKKVRVRISGLEEEEIALLDCLLKNAPSLQTMTVTLPICFENFHDQSILKQLLDLNRFSGQATVLITANQGNKCKRCLASSDDE